MARKVEPTCTSAEELDCLKQSSSVQIDKREERCLVRAKNFRLRTNFSQTFDERRLARGNPARDSDGRHELSIAVPREINESKVADPSRNRALLTVRSAALLQGDLQKENARSQRRITLPWRGKAFGCRNQ